MYANGKFGIYLFESDNFLNLASDFYQCYCFEFEKINNSMPDSKVTINEVARAAGVTNGTVDRVLHNRGEVSAKTKAKVLQVIKDLGYKPNVYASMLARNKSRRIAVLLPSFHKGEFWELVQRGIDQSSEYAGRFSVAISEYYYDQYDIDSFKAQCREILASGPSGVIVAPMFLEGTRQFACQLVDAGIPYIILNTTVDVNSHLAYFGLPMYESGYCCADMLMSGSEPELRKLVFLVKIARDRNRLSDPSAERRKGFLDYLSKYYPDTEVRNVVIDPNNPAEISRILETAFSGVSGRLNIVTLNSRIFLVADYLESKGLQGMNVVGFDMLEKNMNALKNGYVRLLVCQHSDRQALQAVVTLTDFLVIGKKPDAQNNFMSIDLLTRFNCEYY